MIAHIDADSFFASVLLRKHPHLKGKSLLAVGMGGSCVIAATYEAKAKGVKTGMRLTEARKLVPGVIEMDSDFRETGLASEQIESMLKDICPVVEQMSIDEWFLDLGSLVGGCPPHPEQWAKEIQKNILQSTDISVSIGVASSKLLAKMAGEYRKPAGVTVLGPPSPFGRGVGGEGNIETFLRDRPAAAIPGIGPRRKIQTDHLSWNTAWDIASAPQDILRRICGQPGIDLQRELLGERVSPVAQDTRPPKSISRCRSFRATADVNLLKAHLLKHLEYCTLKMRRQALACREISVWLRTADYKHVGAHHRLSRMATTVDEMLPRALILFERMTWQQTRYTQTGLALHGLTGSSTVQQSLFDDPLKMLHEEHLQAAMDTLHTRFGRDSVTRAAALQVKSGTRLDLELPMIN